MLRRFYYYAFAIYLTIFWGSAIGVLIKSLVAKELGKGALGLYSYLVSLLVVTGSVFTLGLPDIITKSIAEDQPSSSDLTRLAITIVFVLAVIASFIAIVTWGAIPEIHSIMLLALGPVTLMPIANAIFRGEISTKRESSYRLLRRTLELVVLIVIVVTFSQAGDIAPAYATLASWYLASFYVLFLLQRRKLLIGPRYILTILREPWMRANLSFSGFLWLAAIITIIGNQADTIIVGERLGYVELGEYAAAMLFIGIIGQVPEALNSIFVSLLARGNNKELPMYEKFLSANLLTIPLLTLLLLPAIPFLTRFFLDDSYMLALPLFALTSFIFVFKSVEIVNRALFINIDWPQGNTKATVFTVVIYLPLLWFLVNQWRLLGAGLCFVLFWAIYNAIQIYLLKARLPQYAQASARMTLITFALYLLSISAYFALPNPLLAAIAGPVLYVGLGQLFGIWDLSQMLRLAREVFGLMQKRLAQRASVP